MLINLEYNCNDVTQLPQCSVWNWGIKDYSGTKTFENKVSKSKGKQLLKKSLLPQTSKIITLALACRMTNGETHTER